MIKKIKSWLFPTNEYAWAVQERVVVVKKASAKKKAKAKKTAPKKKATKKKTAKKSTKKR
jgi:hypothetical protein